MIQAALQHHQILSTAADLGMLAVWGVYLHVFLMGYRRQRRAKIVIHWGGGEGLDATCFISNMSSEAIYIEAVVVCLERSEKRYRTYVTDAKPNKGQTTTETRRGPLLPAATMEIGSFKELADRAIEQIGEKPGSLSQPPDAFDVQVIADYASENLLVGAQRRFRVGRQSSGRLSISSDTVVTRQIRSTRQRRRYQRQLQSRALGEDVAR